jgi:hypothetical protein
MTTERNFFWQTIVIFSAQTKPRSVDLNELAKNKNLKPFKLFFEPISTLRN